MLDVVQQGQCHRVVDAERRDVTQFLIHVLEQRDDEVFQRVHLLQVLGTQRLRGGFEIERQRRERDWLLLGGIVEDLENRTTISITVFYRGCDLKR